ncbi:hypothetical protein LINGRAHAP2_LOCUS10669 [Linum grandiflorum]
MPPRLDASTFFDTEATNLTHRFCQFLFKILGKFWIKLIFQCKKLIRCCFQASAA